MTNQPRRVLHSQPLRRRVGVALAAACPLLLGAGCYGHGHYAYHGGHHGYHGHYHGDGWLLPFAVLYVLFWAAGSC